MMPLRPRQSLGPYELVRALGSGGMGVVYEARHRALGRRVAIKVLHASEPGLPGAAVVSARFLREGRAAAQVRHPHVVDVFDIGVEGDVPYLVMELVLGETLAEKITRDGALSLALTAELLLPIASAVAELHAAGIVHRDLKPSNILLTHGRSGELFPKVADFGVSRLADGSPSLTDKSAVFGTYAYMAPEQARSTSGATALSDLYSLGVVAYECATGKRPFDIATPLELIEAMTHAPLAPPSTWNPALPPAFDAFVRRAMGRDPMERFGSAEEMGEALLAFATPEVARRWADELAPPRSREVASIGSVTSTPKPPAPPGRAHVAWIGAAVLGITIGAGVALTSLRFKDPVPRGTAGPSSAVEVACAVVSSGPVASSPDVAASAVASAMSPSSATPIPTAAPPPRRATRPYRPPIPFDNGAPILDPE